MMMQARQTGQLARPLSGLLAAMAAAASLSAVGQDGNIAVAIDELEPMLQSEALRIESAEISRPGARGDITLRADVAFGGRPPLRVKLRHALPGADAFNNVPRYDIAAYELQKLLLDPGEYVVPPTVLRMLSLEEIRVFAPDVLRTFPGADDVLCVIQYWLQDVEAPADVLDLQHFQSDAVYARHIGQLNIFTYLIEHADSNRGNFLISAQAVGARVFAIDNGVAFDSEPGDRGELWRLLRVERLPADTVARLRSLSEAALASRLGVLAQWALEDGRYVVVPRTENLAPHSGVRRRKDVLQLGLTRSEISSLWERAEQLLEKIDDGEISVL